MRFNQRISSAAVLLLLQGCTSDGIAGPSGQVRPAPTFRLVCSSGMRASGPPLWVVDGERLTDEQGRARGIRPEDVVHVAILNGPAAIAEYGAAGANGVLLIRTRAGVAGDARQEARP